MEKPPSEFSAKREIPMHRQIEKHLRGAISEGRLAYGARVPSVQALAHQYQTSVFTIQTALAALAKDGLIESTRRRGTFVCAETARLTTVGIYFGRDFLRGREMTYYRELYRVLTETLTTKGVSHQFWSDSRAESDHGQPLVTVQKAASKREMQALIVAVTDPAEMSWLPGLNIPLAVHGTPPVPYRVWFDAEQMMKLALGELRRQGCRSVGTILPVPASFFGAEEINVNKDYRKIFKSFADQAADYDLEIRNSWVRIPDHSLLPHELEEYGYYQFQEIWKQEHKPEGLFVFPDIVCRGCITGILETRAHVPHDLKLVLSRNENIPMICPFPVSWLITDVQRVASTLIYQIERQLEGQRVEPIYVPFTLDASKVSPV